MVLDPEWYDHEIPTHVKTQDKVFLFLTFQQLIPLIGCIAVAYFIYHLPWMASFSFVTRIAITGGVGVFGAVMVLTKIGGRLLPLVLFDLLMYALDPNYHEGRLGDVVHETPLVDFGTTLKKRPPLVTYRAKMRIGRRRFRRSRYIRWIPGLGSKANPVSVFRVKLNETAEDAEDPDQMPSLQAFFGISHVTDSYIALSDRSRVVVIEVTGINIDNAALTGLRNALNAIDAQMQLLVRQHAPRLRPFRDQLVAARDESLSPETNQAAESLVAYIEDLENRPGVTDRRFYIVCDQSIQDEATSVVSRMRMRWQVLHADDLRTFVMSMVQGVAPTDIDPDTHLDVNLKPSYIEVRGPVTPGSETRVSRFRASLQMERWPRTVSPYYLQSLMYSGVPMDLSLNIGPIPQAMASKTLEFQKSSMEAAQRFAARRGRSEGADVNISLEDTMKLRDKISRGTEKMFNASLVVTVHAPSQRLLKQYVDEVATYFNASLAKMDKVTFRQKAAAQSSMCRGKDLLGRWQMLETTSITLLFPFNPPDFDTRLGTVVALDTRANSPITYDRFGGTFTNMNQAVLGVSGGGKTFSTKLGMLRDLTRGIKVYVIDPEGEYVNMTHAAGGRVLTPGLKGQGLNPFVITDEAEEDLMQRLQNLRSLIELMIDEPLSASMRSHLDRALMSYYRSDLPSGESYGFHGFYQHLSSEGHPEGWGDLAVLLNPFADGSLQYLLTDEGTDLRSNEAPITTFDLSEINEKMRPAAAMVCSETVWAMATQHPQSRQLVVDEVWSIMRHPAGQDALLSIAKRARKHQLGLTVITQDVQDLLNVDESAGVNGNAGRAMVQNAAIVHLFQQAPAAVDSIEEAFSLDRETLMYLTGLPRGEGLLIRRKDVFPELIEATPEEANIIEYVSGRTQVLQ